MAVSKPAMTLIDLNGVNQWIGTGRPKVAICLHVMQGSLQGCISWFKNPQAQASSNYGVGADGTIVQFVDPFGSNCPYANGIVNQPDATAQALLAQEGNINPNFFTVSIEHEGYSGTPLTPAQIQASAQLTAWLCEQFNIPADEAHLTGHYEWDSVSRAGCPGWDRAGWVNYEAAVNGFLAATPPPDPCADLKVQLAAAQAQAAALQADVNNDTAEITRLQNVIIAVRNALGSGG